MRAAVSDVRPGLRDLVLVAVVVLMAVERGLPVIRAFAQGEPPTIAAAGDPQTGFVYQGRLVADGVPANGTVDLTFRLWDAAESGSQVGTAGPYEDVPVTNGLFATTVDFGLTFGDGLPKWIEVLVRPAGSGDAPVSLGRLPFTVAPHDHLFQDWSGASTTAALALENTGTGDGVFAQTGMGTALEGRSSSNGDPTVWGVNIATGGTAIRGDAFAGNGVVGASSEIGYAATAGIHSGFCNPSAGNVGNVSLACFGLYGSAEGGSNGIGGYGSGSYAGLFGSGSGVGVRGDSISGHGVAGYTSANSELYAGVYGFNSLGYGVSGNGETGVHGDGDVAGVFGESFSGDAVLGVSESGYGVRGDTGIASGAGVLGTNSTAGGCSGLGVIAPVGHCAGVFGSGITTNGIGVIGQNLNGTGVAGWGQHGVFGRSNTRGFGGVIGIATTASNCSTSAANTICYGVIGDATSSPNNAGVGVMGIGTDAGIWGRATGGGLAAIFDGNVQVNGDLTETSDARLKKDIADLAPGLDAVLALRPVTFAWRDESRSGEQQMGFIAQEVRDILPALVHESGNDQGTLSIEPLALLPVLVNAIQEQQAQIDALTGASTGSVGQDLATPWVPIVAIVLLTALVAGAVGTVMGTRLSGRAIAPGS